MADCFQEKERWWLIEQVCQGVKSNALCSIMMIGYCAIYKLTFYNV